MAAANTTIEELMAFINVRLEIKGFPSGRVQSRRIGFPQHVRTENILPSFAMYGRAEFQPRALHDLAGTFPFPFDLLCDRTGVRFGKLLRQDPGQGPRAIHADPVFLPPVAKTECGYLPGL